MRSPPLSLYVHVPWCVRKCPYCDFNSHALDGEPPAARYVDALLADLDDEAPRVAGRVVRSVFIGGGTPSLLDADAIARLLAGVRARLRLHPRAEITLEANPGTAEAGRFAGYRAAGVNRLSVGVQSFDDDLLARIGRIHGGTEARAAIEMAASAGFERVNVDLMFALPGQSPAGALADVEAALGLAPGHVSHYQLTLEPNTLFARRPPALPDGDAAFAMQEACAARLRQAGYRDYEVSAWALPGHACRHNLNYWRFGDYLGIGAGAHGKITDAATGAVERSVKERHPRRYLDRAPRGGCTLSRRRVPASDLAFEFLLNALRLRAGVRRSLLPARTGLALATLEPALREAVERGLLADDVARIVPTPLGRRFLDDLLVLFLPAGAPPEAARPDAILEAWSTVPAA